MKNRSLLWSAFAATLVLTACGGSDSPAPSPAPAPAPTPAPAPGPVPAGDRIEPLDTATLRRSASVKAQAAAASRLPAGAPVPRVALGPLAAPKRAAPAAKGVALQIGQGRDVKATAAAAELGQRLQWQRLADGTQVAAVAFSAEGAQAVRLGVSVQALPDGAVLRFYGADASQVGELTAAELASMRQVNEAAGVPADQARMAWGPATTGHVATLEVQIPAGAAAGDVRLAVPQLSHLTQTLEQALSPKNTAQIGDSGSCNLDAMCAPTLSVESRAVAKMMYTRGSSTYICTGTLMNDTRSSQTPYLLSAAHCISDQSTASTLVTYWFFRAASCNSTPRFDEQASSLGGGATLLFANEGVDTTLLQLNRQPPANVVYAGSYFGDGAVPDVGVIGIHNPAGDLQKYSVGTIRGYANCDSDSSCSSADANSGAMFRIGWQQGTTEGGSSGSAIFAQSGATRYVVGALHGGAASCQNPSGADYYGRFQRSFAAGIGGWLTR